MKKKAFLSIVAMAFAFSLNAQNYTLDTQEDTTDITTLADIIATQSQVTTTKGSAAHYQKVWQGRNKYFNFSYNSTKMYAKPGGINAYSDRFDFKNDLALGLQLGKTYNLHKKALGGIVMLGIDYTYIDLNYNSFKKQPKPDGWDDGEYSNEYGQDPTYANLPFYNKKSELNYGMSVGPAITLYPFSPLHNKATDEIRLQVYFRVGYNFSGMLINKVPDPNNLYSDEDAVNTQIAYGHGVYTTFGFNVGWKGIGIGYESRKANYNNYVPVSKEFDTKTKNKFSQSLGRVYIQYRY